MVSGNYASADRDDERLAHTALANVLSARSDVEHVDSFNDAIDALEKLTTDSYDVLLLDIDLDVSGSQRVDQLRKGNLLLPSIVFVTGHVEHAVAAFERHTVDYVLKPFSKESINEALDRASRRAKAERAAKLIEALPQLQKLSRPGHPMIAIKAKGRILFINPCDVVAVQAEGNYVSLQRESDSVHSPPPGSLRAAGLAPSTSADPPRAVRRLEPTCPATIGRSRASLGLDSPKGYRYVSYQRLSLRELYQVL